MNRWSESSDHGQTVRPSVFICVHLWFSFCRDKPQNPRPAHLSHCALTPPGHEKRLAAGAGTMERVNIVVLASLAAALTLLGLRLFSESAAPSLTVGSADDTGVPFGPDGARDRKLPRSRIAMYGAAPGGAQKATPGTTPGGKKQHQTQRNGGGQSAELIAGLDRRRDVLDLQRRRGDREYDERIASPSDLLAGRVGAVPRPPGGRNTAEHEPDPQAVQQPPKDTANPDVLLR